jgi:hypothetical protein
MGYFLWNQKDEDMVAWVKQFDNFEDPKKLVQQICTMFLAKVPTDAQTQKYTTVLLGNSPEYEWANMLKTVATGGYRLKLLFLQMVKDPGFHLN